MKLFKFIFLFSFFFSSAAFGEDLVLPIAPNEMDDFKGVELRVFAPNPRLVKSTQTRKRNVVSGKRLRSPKRGVGMQTNLKRKTSKKVRRKVRIDRRPAITKSSKGIRKRTRKKQSRVRKNGGSRAPASVASRSN